MPKKKSTKSKNEMSKLALTILLFAVLILTGVGLGALLGHNTGSKDETNTTVETDASRFSREYKEVPADNLFVYRDASQIIDILRGGTGVVFLGFPECQWCQAYAPILNRVAKEAGLEKIYYFNIREDRSNNTEDYQTIVDLLGAHLDLDDEGHPRIFVPDITVVNKGEIIGHDNETSLISDPSSTPENYWTDDKVLDLENKLRSIMSEISGPACVDVCEE